MIKKYYTKLVKAVPKSTYEHPNKFGEGAKKRSKLKNPDDKFEAVMHEFKMGTLHSGSGAIVKDREQALAIAGKESGKYMVEDEEIEEEESTEKEKPMTKAYFPIGQNGNNFVFIKMEKAKYRSKKPDGKGGWIYDYGDNKGEHKNSLEVKILKRIDNLEKEDDGTIDIQTSYIQSFFDVSPQKFKNIVQKNGYSIKEDKKNDSFILSKMEKATTHKYIKRINHPSGKGYLYFYNQKQIKDYKEKGILPEEKKSGGILQGIMNFFGIKDEKKAQEKVKSEYESHRKELTGVSIDSFTDHLNEYLSNKDKWDKRLSGDKKTSQAVSGEKKTVTRGQKTGAVKSVSGKKFNLNVMRVVAGIYGGGKKGDLQTNKGKKIDTREFDTYLSDEKRMNDAIDKMESFQGRDDKEYTKYEKLADGLEKRLQDQVNAATQSYGITSEEFVRQLNEYEENKKNKQTARSDKDNFETMPEGEGEIQKGIEDYYVNIAKEFSNEKPDLQKIKKMAKEKADKINSIMNKEILLDVGGITSSSKKVTLERYNPKDDKMTFKDSTGKKYESTFSKFEKENPNVFKGDKSPVMSDKEKKSLNSVSSPEKLKKRINEELLTMNSSGKKEFSKRIIDFDNKRMISDDGKYVLQWQLRKNPNQPENYNNQQTSVGTVLVKQNPQSDKSSVMSEEGNKKEPIRKELYEIKNKDGSKTSVDVRINEKKNNFTVFVTKRTSPDKEGIYSLRQKYGGRGKNFPLSEYDNFIKDLKNRGGEDKSSKLQKATDLLLSELKKAKKMPIGTVSNGRKKVAEGKWVPVKSGDKNQETKSDTKKDKKKDTKPADKPSQDTGKKAIFRDALKKVANILAEALKGQNASQPAGAAIEQTGENIQANQQSAKKKKPEDKKKPDKKKKSAPKVYAKDQIKKKDSSGKEDNKSIKSLRSELKSLKEELAKNKVLKKEIKSILGKKTSSTDKDKYENIEMDIAKMKQIRIPKEIKQKGIGSPEYSTWVKKNWAKTKSEKDNK